MKNQVQYYDHIKQALVFAPTLKIKKILLNNCLHKINDDYWQCHPIRGYNTNTYNLIRTQRGDFACNCQGYNKNGICSHVRALNLLLERLGDQKQGRLL